LDHVRNNEKALVQNIDKHKDLNDLLRKCFIINGEERPLAKDLENHPFFAIETSRFSINE
jgi:serine/threonine protein kinase